MQNINDYTPQQRLNAARNWYGSEVVDSVDKPLPGNHWCFGRTKTGLIVVDEVICREYLSPSKRIF